MARVLGKSGRYASDQADKQKRNTIVVVCSVIALLGMVEGIVISSFFPLSWAAGWLRLLVLLVGGAAIWALNRWGFQKLNAIEKNRANMERGAAGENVVGSVLEKFPDDFCVINGLSTPNGDLDHVVVGPTGVFVLDAKAWRGVVAADGRGELLINGQPTTKPEIRQFMARMMNVREKVLVLAPGMDAHFSAVFVFTAARVEAKWGTTGRLNCITDDQLKSYIVEKGFGKKLPAGEVNRIAQAFLGLAQMDSAFRENVVQ
jgi:hypothetical protein